ncbi:hypothetical protein GCM10022406_36720 [Hymenobacter algoricola]|uniref:Uncharacterized protein n=2 Tax=Hymenobacter algoricola TaxID=486267 RepID=A0ABP7NPL8_9BACT
MDILLALLLVGSAVFKPSYAFAFVPAYGLLYALQVRFRFKALVRLAVPLLPVVLLIIGQVLWSLAHQEVMLDGGESHIVFALRAGWHTFVPEFTVGHILGSFVSSFALPALAYLICPHWLRRPSHHLALLSVAFGMVIFMFVYETGIRATHGNLVWQVVAANHILHWLILVEIFFWKTTTRVHYWQRAALLGFVGVSVVCAFVHMARLARIGA